ncbi:MAG: cupin domain-containing protein [Halioglobus sp.]
MTGGWRLNLDTDAFLAEYWQCKPLLIKNAIASFVPPLSGDELAGLALEEDVESRIIEQRDSVWRVHHGPFDAADFVRDQPWTLLVQAVDHFVPEVAALFQLVNFIPQWRTDDIMVSYAVDGGNVGPHYDNYDVFLLQGEGQRLWRLGQHCNSNTPLVEHEALRILDSFDCVEEHLLGPGDVLYVPPGIAHWGIAQSECTTFSIGFRAPRIADMLSRCTDDVLLHLDSQQFFGDAGRDQASRPGELSRDDLERAAMQLRQVLDNATHDRWFGELVTEPRYDFEPESRELGHARALLLEGPQLVELSPAAKLAWQQNTDSITVFANGASHNCNANVLPSLIQLCGHRSLQGQHLDNALANPDTLRLLDTLLQSGCIHVQ